MSGKVVKVSGPLVVATGLADANMSDVVRVGPQRLIGEILTMKGDTANIQVYEETSGLGPGAEVELWGDLVPVGTVATANHTIAYELMCHVQRVPRVHC